MQGSVKPTRSSQYDATRGTEIDDGLHVHVPATVKMLLLYQDKSGKGKISCGDNVLPYLQCLVLQLNMCLYVCKKKNKLLTLKLINYLYTVKWGYMRHFGGYLLNNSKNIYSMVTSFI